MGALGSIKYENTILICEIKLPSEMQQQFLVLSEGTLVLLTVYAVTVVQHVYKMLLLVSAHAMLPSHGHCEGATSYTHSPVM